MPSQPSQTKYPWRAVFRSTVASMIGLLPLLPLIAQSLHIETVPFVASLLAVSAAVTRVLAVPGVEQWLRRWAPWLAAATYPTEKEMSKNE